MSDENDLPEIEIHPAHVFTCERCGTDTFVRAVVCELTAEDRRWMVETQDVPEEFAVTGNWMTAPTRVKCGQCGAEFKTVDSRE